jgi:hypothetical protein
MNPWRTFAMLSPVFATVRLIRRSWFKAALLAATILAAGSTSAHAQYVLYYDDNFVETISTHDEFEYVKATSVFVPGTDYIVAYFDAGATSAAPNYYVYLYLIDWSEAGSLAGISEVRDGILDREYAVGFWVNPGHEYSLIMYVENAQDSARWWFYTNYLEIVEYEY